MSEDDKSPVEDAATEIDAEVAEGPKSEAADLDAAAMDTSAVEVEEETSELETARAEALDVVERIRVALGGESLPQRAPASD